MRESFVTFGNANATLSKKKSSLAAKRNLSRRRRWIELNSLSWLKAKRTKSIVALLGDVVLLLHDQLQLALPLNVGVLTVLDHVVDRPGAKWRNC